MPKFELIFSDPNCEIHHCVVGPLDNNVFILRCVQSGKSLLVDAADEPAFLAQAAKDFNVIQVVETHGHRDHIQAVPAMQAIGLAVGIGRHDADRLPTHDFLLDHNEFVQVGELVLEVIHTPGHTPGSCCFSLESSSILFSGDTLFPGGPGNTTFPGGDFATIIESIDALLFKTLKPDTLVLPGHGRFTTLEEELPYLDSWRQRGY